MSNISSGNVGIGYTDPAEKLSVNGNISLSGQIKLNGISMAKSASGNNLKIDQRFEDKTGPVMPVGTVLVYSGDGTTIPDGWLICDGRELPINATYQDLYNVIKTTYGGDGVTKFRLPDFRGQFLRGSDNMGTQGPAGRDPDFSSRSGGAGSFKIGSTQGDVYGSHGHSAGTYKAAHGGAHDHKIEYWVDNNGQQLTFGIVHRSLRKIDHGHIKTKGGGNHSHDVTGSSGAAGGSETRPKNVNVIYVIKY